MRSIGLTESHTADTDLCPSEKPILLTQTGVSGMGLCEGRRRRSVSGAWL